MNLTPFDWGIVVLALGLMIASVMSSRRLMRSVSDFLAAGRTAGRYMMTVATGAAALGAITVVGNLEMNLIAGFSMTWWGFSMALVVLLITVSGWVIYRFRQTRCLTLAQFFELRYSRRFRVFAGTICFLSGIVNFGIFPAVVARFFIYFCGLPQQIAVLGLSLPTFPLTMLVLIGIALWFVFTGGQISVMVGDVFQGILINATFLALVLYLFLGFDWAHIREALGSAPADASLINPFHTSQVRDFNLWYFLIGVFGVIYNTMSWQGTQAYNASARSAHEAKMGQVLSSWRMLPQTLLFLFLPIVAYAVLHHPSYSGIASAVESGIAGAGTEAVQSQLRVPMVLSHLLPPGLMGLFAAVMLAAFISTHDAYMHSWGSILVQDVVLPLRGRPFSKEQHLKVLRLAIVLVAAFIFAFSMLFKQSQYIFLFFAITGAIFAGGSGAVIIGGLYWKRGTTAAAWAAMITGSTIAVGGIGLQQAIPNFPINGQVFWMISMAAASLVYVTVSLLGRRGEYDLDRLLHRGRHTLPEESRLLREKATRGWRMLGMGREFSAFDRSIYVGNYIWTGVWVVVFLAGTIYNLSHEVNDEAWLGFWRLYLWVNIGLAAITVLWFTGGSLRDLRRMFRSLDTSARDDTDDGYVSVAGGGRGGEEGE